MCSMQINSGQDKSINTQLWFIGSRVADALLLRVDSSTEGSSDANVIAKKRKLHVIEFGDSINIVDHEQEEELLYGMPLEGTRMNGSMELLDINIRPLNVVVQDSLPSVGPILDGLFSGRDDALHNVNQLDWDRSHTQNNMPPSANSSSSLTEKENKDILQVCAGVDEHATLLNVYSGWSFKNMTSHNFMGATSVLSLAVHPKEQQSNGGYSVLLLIFDSKTRILHLMEKPCEGISFHLPHLVN